MVKRISVTRLDSDEGKSKKLCNENICRTDNRGWYLLFTVFFTWGYVHHEYANIHIMLRISKSGRNLAYKETARMYKKHISEHCHIIKIYRLAHFMTIRNLYRWGVISNKTFLCECKTYYPKVFRDLVKQYRNSNACHSFVLIGAYDHLKSVYPLPIGSSYREVHKYINKMISYTLVFNSKWIADLILWHTGKCIKMENRIAQLLTGRMRIELLQKISKCRLDFKNRIIRYNL